MQKGAPARCRFLHTFLEKFKWVFPFNVSASMIFGSLLAFERDRRLENTVHGGEMIVSTSFWSSSIFLTLSPLRGTGLLPSRLLINRQARTEAPTACSVLKSGRSVNLRKIHGAHLPQEN